MPVRHKILYQSNTTIDVLVLSQQYLLTKAMQCGCYLGHIQVLLDFWSLRTSGCVQVLGIVAGVLLQDHDVRHTDFQQLPYHRIFIMLFIELNAPEQVLESINFEVLQSFWYSFHSS